MVFGQVFSRRRPGERRITVNVGGFRQALEPELLRRFPTTRLGRLLRCRSSAAVLELCDDFSPAEMEFYFDRSPWFFCCVLNFYLTGSMHLLDGWCVVSFRQEMEYWGIREGHLGLCCSSRFHERTASVDHQRGRGAGDPPASPSDEELSAFGGSWCGGVRRSIWICLEKPGSSGWARAAAALSLTVVVGSIASMCAHSVAAEADAPLLAYFDGFCVLFFSAEFVLRLSAAPSLGSFLCNTLNVIDFLSVAPFFVAAAWGGAAGEESADLGDVGKVVQTLKLMRVFRILKLARHSAGLRSLGATLQHSAREVGQLVLFVSVGVFLFSTLMYFAERDAEESPLRSIPAGWWWATISMTTVGYGDAVPVTLAGKLVATSCIVCGLLIVALPITNIFNKFSKFYQKQADMELRHKMNVAWADGAR